MNPIMRILFALLCGLIFGFGLALSGMLNPSKIFGFLNIFGHWDPSLAFVMGGGVIVNAIGHYFIVKKQKPLFSEKFELPINAKIDKPLLLGSGIFGIGWGISGLCPGPVVANILLNPSDIFLFLFLVVIGLWIGKKLKKILS